MERPAIKMGDQVEGLVIENIQLREPCEPQEASEPKDSYEPQNPWASVTRCTKVKQCYRPVEGILLMILASFLSTATSGVVKYLDYIGPGQMAALIGVFSTFFLVQYSFFYGVSLVKFKVWYLVLTRCVLGSLGFLMKVYAIKNMNYGDAVALFFTGPIWAGVFARVFLKEKYSVMNMVSAVLGVTGIVLIAKPTFIFGVTEGDDGNPVLASCVAVSGAMLFGVVFCVMSHIGKRVNTVVISTYQSVCMMISGAAFQLITSTPLAYPMCHADRVLLIITGVGSAMTRVCINRALAVEKAGAAALIRNLDTVLAYVIQMLVFKVSPNWMSLVGAGLIITGTLGVGLNRLFNKSNRWEL